MIDRICISINNRCNLACSYCHFHEKGKIEAAEMDVFEILNNVIDQLFQFLQLTLCNLGSFPL